MKILIYNHLTPEEKQKIFDQFPEDEFIDGLFTQENIDEADIIIGNPPLKFNLNSPRLKALLLNSAGSDVYCRQGMLHDNTVLCNASGSYGKCLAEYTTSDAVGALAANAMNNFEQGKTAMIANGTWMTADFDDPEKTLPELKDKIGVAEYPESGLIEQYEVGYVLCTNGEDKEVQEAALEFFKFKTGKRAQEIFLEDSGALPLTDQVKMSDEFVEANPLIAELVDMSNSNKWDFNNIDNTAVASTIEAFSAYYPDLAAGNLTPEDMAAKLTEAAAKTK